MFQSIDPSLAPAAATATRAAATAGQIVKSFFRREFTVRVKSGPDMVTEADVAAERAIVATIREDFPNHAVLAEEEHRAAVDADDLWIIDPIDGTTNFMHGVPQVGISIAYYQRGVPRVAVIHNPVRDDWFTAAAGSGAWWNGEPVHVQTAAQLSQALVATGFYYERSGILDGTLAVIRELYVEESIHCIRRMGAASLDLCMVGCGMFGAYFEFVLSPWDFAAGRLFVDEAGGRVTDCHGAELPLARSSILATNGTLHEAMLKHVRGRV